MTLESGNVGSSYVGSDHVGWLTKYSVYSGPEIKRTARTLIEPCLRLVNGVGSFNPTSGSG